MRMLHTPPGDRSSIRRNKVAASRGGSGERAHLITTLLRAIMAVTLACTAAYALLPVTAASAAPGPASDHYSKLWIFKSSQFGVCMNFEVSGTITYDTSVTFIKGNPDYHWTSVTLVKPVLTATVYALKSGACSTTLVSKTTHMVMSQAWSGYGCSFNPSVSFGFPWAVGVGFWPSCGSRERAVYSFDDAVKHDNYVEDNSGNEPLGDFDSGLDIGPCYGVYIAAEAYVGSVSDSATSGSYSVCLPAF